MIDSYGRRIDYLRISVTDRCNLRRELLHAAGKERRWLRRRDILSLEEIAEVCGRCSVHGDYQVAAHRRRASGAQKRRRSGALCWPRSIGVRDLAMTTNGTLLARYARWLAAAGLHRVNVSLDAVDPARYAAISAAATCGRCWRALMPRGRPGWPRCG